MKSCGGPPGTVSGSQRAVRPSVGDGSANDHQTDPDTESEKTREVQRQVGDCERTRHSPRALSRSSAEYRVDRSSKAGPGEREREGPPTRESKNILKNMLDGARTATELWRSQKRSEVEAGIQSVGNHVNLSFTLF